MDLKPTLHDILKATEAARKHARLLAKYDLRCSRALNRFEEEVKQAQEELTLRISPEIDGKVEGQG